MSNSPRKSNSPRNKFGVGVTSLAFLAVALTGCGDDDPDDSASAATNSTSASATPSEDASSPPTASAAPSEETPGTGTTVDLYDKDFPISWQQALDNARSDFKGDVMKIELEPDDRGRYHYKIELSSKTQKYAVQYDAESGDEINKKTEDLDADDRAERASKIVDLDNVIDLKQAMDAARKVQDGAINAWKVEGDERTGPHYEFDIDRAAGGNEDYEVKVDAMTGEVLPDTDD